MMHSPNPYQSAAYATITDIKRFSSHDGPGIRTMVFFKGCPLRCQWCQNPETWDPRPEIMYYADSCIGCGHCVAACPQQALSLHADGVHIDSARCVHCGKCADSCFSGAMKRTGEKMSVDQVFNEVMKDEVFYRTSGGGVTLSGGECTVYASFAAELLHRLQAHGVNTAIETCGYCGWPVFSKILRYVDLVLFDIKVPVSKKSKQYTGRDCALILDNIRKASKMGKHIVLRFPMIPGVNDDDATLHFIGRFAHENHIRELHILPFHQMGSSKWHALGRSYACENWETPSDEQTAHAKELLESYQLFVSVGGTEYDAEVTSAFSRNAEQRVCAAAD